ncbi:replication initiation protein [Commensalibacter oyaizuii]|uniref:replication initiation protein n=1 Tax=Commensalibacter oyaizuii TaxID=3043873 RepID=UPI0038D04ECC
MYSRRLLELFEQQKQIDKNHYRWLKISIGDFNHAMELLKSYQRIFGIINQKVIEPAVKELSEKSQRIRYIRLRLVG